MTGLHPYLVGDQKIHALSEIEVWSAGKNVAGRRPVTRTWLDQTFTTQTLTDGNTSEKRISSFATWLDQLAERGRIERELALLRPIQRQQASESEINATWGSAMILGLTFLIPVFIVERRRLMSRDQLDQIRKRIASDLHDDIGSNLGCISLIARTARKDLVRLQGPEEVAQDLGEVESIARESSLAMRDIVWLLERRQDSIGDLGNEDDLTCPHHFTTADELFDKLKFTNERPDLLLLDLGLPRRNGLDVLSDVRILPPDVKGLIKKEIATELCISLHTVDMHLRSVYRKLEVRSQTEAVSKALRQGLV